LAARLALRRFARIFTLDFAEVFTRRSNRLEPHHSTVARIRTPPRLMSGSRLHPQFLNVNGFDIAIEDSVPWAEAVVALIEHRTTEEDFAALIRPFVVPRD